MISEQRRGSTAREAPTVTTEELLMMLEAKEAQALERLMSSPSEHASYELGAWRGAVTLVSSLVPARRS